MSTFRKEDKLPNVVDVASRTFEDLYTKGDYLKKQPTWHVEESPWKAKAILTMLKQNHLQPKTICEVGCGAESLLREDAAPDEHALSVDWGAESATI